jgi:hypothetical protein
MRIIDAAALSGFARKTAQSASDFASVVHELIMDVRDSYRPEQYYMRGPGRNGAPSISSGKASILKPDRRPDTIGCPRCMYAVAMQLTHPIAG